MAKPKIINIKRVDTDSEKCPQLLKLVLRANIRDVFTRRREVANATLSNAGIDAFLDLWWSHHHKIIRAFSFRPEWDWSTLSLHFDKQVLRPVNLLEAKKDYLTLLARPNYLDRSGWAHWNYNPSQVVPFTAVSDGYLGSFHALLYSIFVRAFDELILESRDITPETQFTDDDAYVSIDTINRINTFVDEHSISSETIRGRGAFCMKGIASLLSDDENAFISFNKLPSSIFEKVSALRNDGDRYATFFTTLEVYFSNHFDDFLADLYSSIRVNQISNGRGPIKTTICNKLVKSFYDWLTALTVGFSGNPFSLVDNDFNYYRNALASFVFYSELPIKIRPNGHEGGYELVNYGTLDQIFARLQENCKGTYNRESFIISFHPCDMITCSLGYNWSSCQSWINNFTDLPDGYGIGSDYSGMYNRGNFQFMCGNGFIAYIPYEPLSDTPQYLWAKKKRCLLWVGDNLDCIRQNDFYPGHPKDQESIALAKVIREFIQEVLSPFNFSNGTMDWKVKYFSKDGYRFVSAESAGFDKIIEEATPVSGRFNDPIFALSYLKSAIVDGQSYIPTLHYAVSFPRFDTGLPAGSTSWTSSFFSSTRGTCPICGKHTSRGGICPKCSKELIIHNGKKVHPSDLVTINVDGESKSFDLSEVEQLNDFVTAEDGTCVNFKSAFKVFMPSGIKYFKELPDYVKQCKVCKEYFHPSFMIGDVCIEHFNTALASDNNGDIDVDLDKVLITFLAGTLSFDCNDTENLLKLLRKLDDHKVTWLNGARPSEFFPKTDVNKRMFLSVSNGKLLLSRQALATVIKVSNLFKKGGE